MNVAFACHGEEQGERELARFLMSRLDDCEMDGEDILKKKFAAATISLHISSCLHFKKSLNSLLKMAMLNQWMKKWIWKNSSSKLHSICPRSGKQSKLPLKGHSQQRQ